MKVIAMSLLVFIVGCQKISESEIDQHLRDLNVLFEKRNVVKMNIQNINTTRTQSGGVYIPKEVINCKPDGTCDIVPISCAGVGCPAKSEPRAPIMKYEPNHPDANVNGYVAYPQIHLSEEQDKLEKIDRGIQLLLGSKVLPPKFFFSKEAEKYFKKYSALDKAMNYRKFLDQ